MIHQYRGMALKVHAAAFVDASAHVIGDVELAEDAGVWFNVVIRGAVVVPWAYLRCRPYGFLIAGDALNLARVSVDFSGEVSEAVNARWGE